MSVTLVTNDMDDYFLCICSKPYLITFEMRKIPLLPLKMYI